MKTKTIPFEKDVIRDYLDRCIVSWRVKKNMTDQRQMAIYYIDAFQSVRMTLFGAVLPEPYDPYSEKGSEDWKD